MSRDRVSTKEPPPDDAVRVAQCLMNDFIALIAIFDRQDINQGRNCRDFRDGVSDARLAAERGLHLSEQLVELLRKNG